MDKIVTAPPKSIQVADLLREEIQARRLQPGDRLQPARTLAARFEVSKQVVQRSFAILEREGLLESHVGRGTFIAAAGKSIASRTVLLMLDGTTDKHRRIPITLTSSLQQKGFIPYLFDTAHSHEASTIGNIKSLLAERPRAFVVAGYCRFNFDLLEYVQPETHLVLVTHFEGAKEYMASYILEDFVEAGRRAAGYLLSRGRKRIVTVSYAREPGWTSDHLLTGFEAELAGEGLAVRRYFEGTDAETDFMREFAGDEPPDGVFCTVDYQYGKVGKCAAQEGLILGRDFDAIGVGNTPWSNYFGIASLDHREEEFASAVTEAVESGERRRVKIVPSVVLPLLEQ